MYLITRKYKLLLSSLLLVLFFASCHKGGEPMPCDAGVDADEVVVSSARFGDDEGDGDDGGDSHSGTVSDIVGGDDNEDDDGSGIVGGDDNEDDDIAVKGSKDVDDSAGDEDVPSGGN